MIHQLTESLLEIGLFAGLRVKTLLGCFGNNMVMVRNILAHVQHAFTAIVGLFFVLHATQNAITRVLIASP